MIATFFKHAHVLSQNCPLHFVINFSYHILHPRRASGSQSGREKRHEESFQARAEESLGSDSQQTISKRKRKCRLLIGHKKCLELFCPITVKFDKISNSVKKKGFVSLSKRFTYFYFLFHKFKGRRYEQFS